MSKQKTTSSIFHLQNVFKNEPELGYHHAQGVDINVFDNCPEDIYDRFDSE